MQLKITGQHIHVTDTLKEHIRNKLTKIIGHFEKVIDVHVILKVEKERHIAEAKVHIANRDFFARVEGTDMYGSIEQMMGKLDSQILKHKQKKRLSGGQGGEKSVW